MRALLLSVGLVLASCDTFFAANDPGKRTVEGCAEAVEHLKQCCPLYTSYLSCSYFESAANANYGSDLSPGQSRCLQKKSCETIEKAVTGGGSLCDMTLRDKRCR